MQPKQGDGIMVRLSILVVAVLAIGPTGPATPTQKTGKARPQAELRDPHDLLGLLKAGDPGTNSPSYKDLVKRLEKGKVPTTRKAEEAAIAHKLKHGGLLAEEGAKVEALLRIAVDVPDFASSGDLVWVVRISHLARGVTQEMWISSTTGAIRTMLPVGKPK
jgi:hypothetical protein